MPSQTSSFSKIWDGFEIPPEMSTKKDRFESMYNLSQPGTRDDLLKEALGAVLTMAEVSASAGEIKLTWSPHIPNGTVLTSFLGYMREDLLKAITKTLAALHLTDPPVIPGGPTEVGPPAAVLKSLASLLSYLDKKSTAGATEEVWNSQKRDSRVALFGLTGIPPNRPVTTGILEDIGRQFHAKAETAVGAHLAGKSAPTWVTKFLVNRGVTSAEGAEAMVGDSDPRHDPLEMSGMTEAVSLVNDMFKNDMLKSEKTCVFGDYDLDGISGTAMLAKALKRLGFSHLMTKLPTRNQRVVGGESGYGVNDSDVQAMADAGVKNLILVDTGTNANEPIALAKKLGMKVLVLDHHLPEHHLVQPGSNQPTGAPDADVMLNPHKHGDTYKNKELSAVGVVHKLITELYKHHGRDDADDFLDYAGLGMLADQMEMSPENRYMVKKALSRLGNSKFPGVKALADGKHKDGAVSSQDVGFGIIPLLNAPGRIEEPDHALRLLMADNDEDAQVFKGAAEKLNDKRKVMSSKIEEEAKEAAKKVSDKSVIFLYNPDWHPGVVGLVAPSIVEIYHKPVALAGLQAGGQVVGSARAPDGSDFSWVPAMQEAKAKGLLLKGGGHAHAAGFSLSPSNVDALGKFFEEYGDRAESSAVDSDQAVDHVVGLDELGADTLKWLHTLEPFGRGNPEPLFEDRDVLLEKVWTKTAGESKTMTEFLVSKNGVAQPFKCMMWGTDNAKWLTQHIGKTIGIKYTPEYSTFDRAPQVRVKSVF